MKIIDKLIIRKFVGPYILAFFIAEFVLLMQLMWKYVDDILGKGVTILEVLELLFYFSVTIIPMALPVSILLASLMVYGDMSEKYELTSLKTAGVSMTRIMKPAIAVSVITALFSVFASNFMKPTANFQFKKRFDTIRRQKPMLSIDEGVFNEDFRNYVIRIGKKYGDGKRARDILLYDHTEVDRSTLNLIIADSALMYTNKEGRIFVMKLISGVVNRELTRERKDNGRSSYPFIRTEFDTWTKAFDLNEFFLDKDELDYARKEDMMNTFQILTSIDTIDAQLRRLETKRNESFKNIKIAFERKSINEQKPVITTKENKNQISQHNADTILEKANNSTEISDYLSDSIASHVNETKKKIQKLIKKPNNDIDIYPDSTNNTETKYLWTNLDSIAFQLALTKAITTAGARYDIIQNTNYQSVEKKAQRGLFIFRLNQQYAYGVICIIFLFIGAPLGSIIRKGGYGYPVLVAIIFYMIFIISGIYAEKVYKNGQMSSIMAAWFPCLLQLPFALFFTYEALHDRRFAWLTDLTSGIFKRHFFRSTRKSQV